MEHTAYKARLDDMLQVLIEELKTVGVHNPDNAADWVAKTERDDTDDADDNLTADHFEDLNERTAIVADLETRYNNITGALARIASNTFGVCEVCSAPIETERLDANPAARTCIEHRDTVI